MLEIIFLWLASICYLVFKVVAKLTYLVAIIGSLVTTRLPLLVRFMTKQNSIWSKALIMPLTIWNCVLSYKQKNYFSENQSQGSWVRYPVWQHTFVSPSAFSRRAVVSYWRKYVHEVLVNRLGGLSLPRKSVVRLTDQLVLPRNYSQNRIPR